MTGALEERYTFADALAVGTYLNIFVRNCDWVRMTNLAQMVNVIAPIVTTPDAVALQPIYYPVLCTPRPRWTRRWTFTWTGRWSARSGRHPRAGGRTASRIWARSVSSTRPRVLALTIPG